jgi:hypothetical protein
MENENIPRTLNDLYKPQKQFVLCNVTEECNFQFELGNQKQQPIS